MKYKLISAAAVLMEAAVSVSVWCLWTAPPKESTAVYFYNIFLHINSRHLCTDGELQLLSELVHSHQTALRTSVI